MSRATLNRTQPQCPLILGEGGLSNCSTWPSTKSRPSLATEIIRDDARHAAAGTSSSVNEVDSIP